MTALWFAPPAGAGPGDASSRTRRRCSTPSSTCSATSTARYLTELRELRRPAGLPVAHQGPRPGRLLDRLGRPRRGRAAVRGRGPSLRRRCTSAPRPAGRFVALIGDAELDEGNVWEAIARAGRDQGLGNVLWIVDLNRQSLDRVVPGMKVGALERHVRRTSGWQVLEVKYGRRLRAAFAEPGARGCGGASTRCPTRSTRRCSRLRGAELRDRVPRRAPTPTVRGRARRAVRRRRPARRSSPNLGGHDLGDAARRVRGGRRRAPTDRRVVFAYTMKGWGLPFAGDPLNHSALLIGRADRRAARRGRASRRRPSGTASTPTPTRAGCVRTRPSGCDGPTSQRPTARIAVPSHDAVGALAQPSRRRPRRRSAGVLVGAGRATEVGATGS